MEEERKEKGKRQNTRREKEHGMREKLRNERKVKGKERKQPLEKQTRRLGKRKGEKGKGNRGWEGRTLRTEARQRIGRERDNRAGRLRKREEKWKERGQRTDEEQG